MPQHYAPLPPHSLAKLPTFHQPLQVLPEKVEMHSPATDVMTDLKQAVAVFIFVDRDMEAAKQRMVSSSVRLLLAIDEHNHVVGLITASDLLGEKPMQFIMKNGGRREDIRVRDIMTPQDKLEVLYMKEVAGAKVGNIVATLKESGRLHALVVDSEDNVEKVRGIFSLTQIARQLGIQIHTHEFARTFAEIQSRLGA